MASIRRQARNRAGVTRAKGHIFEGRRKSSCKTEGDRQGGAEKVLRSAGGEVPDGAMLLLRVFDITAAFARALALQASCGPRRQLGGSMIHSAEKWSRHVMVSLLWRAKPSGSRSPTLGGAPSPRQHPGSPRLARPSPASRDRRAALTLGWERGESGADFCHLGSGLRLSKPLEEQRIRLRPFDLFFFSPPCSPSKAMPHTHQSLLIAQAN